MKILVSLLVVKPLTILGVAAFFFAAHFLVRFAGIGPGRHPRALLVVFAAWALYGVWEWLVVTITPEANIRVDLMLIWPVLLVLSAWFTIRAFR